MTHSNSSGDRVALQNDELGRSWVSAVSQHGSDAMEDAIFLLVSIVDDEPLILGNGFIIYAHNNMALCLGAAHSFDAVARHQRSRTKQAVSTMPSDFLRASTQFIKTDSIFATVIGEKIVTCHVRHVCYIDNYDVVLFSIEAPQEHRFPGRFAIDLSMPLVGEQLSVLGNFSELSDWDGSAFIVRRRFEMRMGIVTSVNVQRGRLGQSFTFETTIPFPAGLSGAPILRNDGSAGQLAIACGCVSHDLSSDEAFKSFLVPGHSTASMLWPAMGHGVPSKIETSSARMNYLADIAPFLDTRPAGVFVTLQPADNGQVELLYQDLRCYPPYRLCLTMTNVMESWL